ncbi:MAG: cytochrome c oxidase assembly protein [Gammaproteobacteria bacterium]|nr:cytochrome c oxidase assembly protein [Gammaproteobacteria bacterium]NIR82204.1 cytochrome c oxidase assembly protein [Gammaproteobacteria bacterium]NIR90803.1 cytochrome c oxidase assembly protein [Gammaproteobacteria bacterium]NIU03354.1 cytochrome c oxidase assembly protein [Gammaproteobacteria bacterium]NIV50850.1 cytochrome c oxidase assembly protein [Gammaproteobacteria bacterium]
MTDASRQSATNARTARRLALVVLAMFGFGYALVPLYDVICEVTGLGGRTGVVEAGSLDGGVDAGREITVQFVSNVASDLPWEFRPVERTLRIHPGQVYETTFYARNRSDETIVAQAVPSVTPALASKHFNKTECFCFTRQTLGPGEAREMPVRFVVDQALSQRYTSLTLGYTFFRADKSS